MSGEIFSFDEDKRQGVDTPCLCHGLDAEELRKKPRRVTWLPMTSQVSLEMLRPVLDLAIVRLLEKQGKVPAWTQRADVERMPLVRVDRWIEEVSASLREPALGLLALVNVQRGWGQVVELAAERAPTVKDALLVLARHIGLLNEAASFHLHVQGEKALLVMGSRLLMSHAMRDYLAGSFALSVARWLGSRSGLELWFAGPRPTYALSYRSALGEISVGFYAPCDALVLPAALLEQPLPLADAKLHDFLLRLAQRVASYAP